MTDFIARYIYVFVCIVTLLRFLLILRIKTMSDTISLENLFTKVVQL